MITLLSWHCNNRVTVLYTALYTSQYINMHMVVLPLNVFQVQAVTRIGAGDFSDTVTIFGKAKKNVALLYTHVCIIYQYKASYII